MRLSEAQITHFRNLGYLILSQPILPQRLLQPLRDRCEGLFKGQFETGVYPDEWHWREGISMPQATREIVNAWKS